MDISHIMIIYTNSRCSTRPNQTENLRMNPKLGNSLFSFDKARIVPLALSLAIPLIMPEQHYVGITIQQVFLFYSFICSFIDFMSKAVRPLLPQVEKRVARRLPPKAASRAVRLLLRQERLLPPPERLLPIPRHPMTLIAHTILASGRTSATD